MKRRVFQAMAFAMLCALLMVCAFAADTVYVDGVGTAENCYATLKAATDAVDEGGTVILTADYTTPSSAALTLTANKTVTITSEGNKKLTLSRAMILGGDTTFENLTIVNAAATGVDYIYSAGHTLTVGEGVSTVKSASNRYLILLAGPTTDTCTGGHVIVKSGTWRSIYGGGYSPTMSGTVYIEMYGGTLTNSIFFGNLNKGTSTADVYVTVAGGTVPSFVAGVGHTGTKSITLTGGTVTTLGFDATVDLTLGGAVTVGTESEGVTVTTKTAEGYTVLHEGTKYTVPFVYVDGTGATPGAFTDFKAAVTALPDAGGTVTFTADTQVGTATAGVTLPTKSGKVTVTSENDAKFIFARSLTLNCDLEFTDIEIQSTATASGNLICRGHHLTIASDVTTTVANKGMYLALVGGADVDASYDTHLTVRAGTFRAIYGANYSKTFTGHSVVEISNAVSTGTLSAENYTGTFSGTRELILDLTDNKTVKAATYKHEPTEILVDEGWAAAKVGDVYMQYPAYEGPAPTTVYVDASGKTEGAYTSFTYALIALAKEGGTIVVSGDTQFGTTGSGGGVVLSDYKDFTGGITFRSENGAKLIFARSFRLNCDVTFEDLNIHSIIPAGNIAVNNIICCGNTFTVGEGVVMTKESKAIWPSIIGGQDANTSYDSHVIVKGGNWQDVYAAGYSGTFSGNSALEISNATVVGKLSAESRTGTFSGSSAMTLDLTGGKTVTAGTYVTEPTTILVDEGYKAVLDGNTYKQEVIHVHDHKAVVTAPTCTEKGHTTYTCACGDTYVADEVPATGHVNTTETVVDATCSTAGSKTVTCACGEVISTEEIPATGNHSYDDGVIDPPAKPGAAGIKTYTCSVCGHTYTEEVPALGVAAQIGDVKYETLTDAFAAAEEGDTIVALTKITIEGDTTWDLTGKTLVLAEIADNYSVVVKGNLTINGGAFVANTLYGIGVQANGTLTVNGGEFSTDKDYYLIGTWGKTTINGGTFTAVYNNVNCFAGTLAITGGNFTVTGTDEEYPSSDVFAEDGGVASVSGGIFSTDPTDYLAEGYQAVAKDGVWGIELAPVNVPGDVNGDTEITVADVLLLVKAVLDDTALANADMNGDGELTLLDVIKLMKASV